MGHQEKFLILLLQTISDGKVRYYLIKKFDIFMMIFKKINSCDCFLYSHLAFLSICHWLSVSCMRIFWPMKLIRTQIRCFWSIFSNVAMNLAKGPVSNSTLSPLVRLFCGRSVPDASHFSIKPEISWGGSGLGLPLKLTSFDTPIVLLIVVQGPNSEFALTKHVSRKNGPEIIDKARCFSDSDFLHRQKRFKPLLKQATLCQDGAVGFEKYKYHSLIMNYIK